MTIAYIDAFGEIWTGEAPYYKPLGGYRCADGYTFSHYVKKCDEARTIDELIEARIEFTNRAGSFPLIYLDFFRDHYIDLLAYISGQTVKTISDLFNEA